VHVGGRHQGTHTDLFPCSVLHVHGPLPASRALQDDGGIVGHRACFVLTYGRATQQRRDQTNLEQLFADHPVFRGPKAASSGAFGTGTGRSRSLSRVTKRK